MRTMQVALPVHMCALLASMLFSQLLAIKSFASPLLLGRLIDSVSNPPESGMSDLRQEMTHLESMDLDMSRLCGSIFDATHIQARRLMEFQDPNCWSALIHSNSEQRGRRLLGTSTLAANACFTVGGSKRSDSVVESRNLIDTFMIWIARRIPLQAIDILGLRAWAPESIAITPDLQLQAGLALLLVLEAAGAVLQGLHEVASNSLGISVTATAQNEFMRSVLGQEPAYLESTHSAVFVQAMGKLQLVSGLAGQLLPDLFKNIVQVVLAGTYLLWVDPMTSSVLVCMLPAVAAVERFCDSLVDQVRKDLLAAEKLTAKHRSETFGAASAIKMWSWETVRCHEHSQLMAKEAALHKMLSVYAGMRTAVNASTLAIASTTTWYMGLGQVLAMKRTLGSLTASAVVVDRVRHGLATIVKHYRQYLEHTRQLAPCFEMMDRQSHMPLRKSRDGVGSATVLTGFPGAGSIVPIVRRDRPRSGKTANGSAQKAAMKVELRDVWFSYDSVHELKPALGPDFQSGAKIHGKQQRREFLFAGLSLEFKPGTVTAICGPSGSGKTTLANLILRMRDPTRGIVAVDGVDVRDLPPAAYHRRTAVVAQHPVLFSISIRDNIAFGCVRTDGGPVSLQNIVRAAKLANAHDFICNELGGYDAVAGEAGNKMSGGMQQRIQIARAILADPDLLVLDEATSALDSVTEHIVQDALERVFVGRTVVVIAHRLSTISRADRIVLLKDGKIAEIGTHAELSELKGDYAALLSSYERSSPSAPEHSKVEVT